MSVKTALAKLAAAAAGGARLGGGAVHVAEPQSADVTTFKSTKAPVKYTKGPARRVVLKTPTPKKVKRIRRVIEDQPECEEDCKPRMAMVPIPLPQAPAPLPAFAGSSGGGVTVVGGSGGFGGGFGGGFFGGFFGGSSGGSSGVIITSTTTTRNLTIVAAPSEATDATRAKSSTNDYSATAASPTAPTTPTSPNQAAIPAPADVAPTPPAVPAPPVCDPCFDAGCSDTCTGNQPPYTPGCGTCGNGYPYWHNADVACPMSCSL